MASVERLDSTATAWETQPDMANCRMSPAAGVLGNAIYVCGGLRAQELGDFLAGSVYSRSCERFDPSNGAWELIPSMTVCRGHAAAVSLSQMLYVCGGSDGHQRHSSAERLDPAAAAWEVLPSMTNCRRDPAVAVADGKIYVCGGCDGVRFLSSAERFDPALGQWEALRPMSARRGAASAAVLEHRLYVCGGHDGVEFRRSVERFDPATGMWELLPPMRSRRSSASAVALRSFAPHWLLEPPSAGPMPAPAPHPSNSSARPPLGGVGPLPGDVSEHGDVGLEGLPSPPSMLGTPT